MDKNNLKRVVLFSLILIMLTTTLASAADTTVHINDVSLDPGESITAPIMIENVTNVKGAHVLLNYDASIVQVTSIGASDFNLETFKDINNSGGYTRYAAVTAFLTTSGGMSGNVKFADVTLKAVGNGGAQSPLSIEVVSLNNGLAEIPRDVISGTFNIIGSSNNDGLILGGGGGGGGGGGFLSQDDEATPAPTETPLTNMTENTVVPEITNITEASLEPTQPTTPPTEPPEPPASWILLSGAVFMIIGAAIASYLILPRIDDDLK